jgi:hypothetical protein
LVADTVVIILQKFPTDPFVVIDVVIVWVVEAVKTVPTEPPALFKFRTLKVLEPLTVTLSFEKVTTLKVLPPPAKVVEDPLTIIVEVSALNVGADVAKSQTVPVPVQVHVVAPRVRVLVPEDVTYFPQLTANPLALKVPAVCVNVPVTAFVIAEFSR